MSYKSAMFPISKPGLYLISGENGEGKSSIPDSISWCLFGKTVRGVEGDAVINRKTKRNCMVQVALEHKSYRYKVTRYRKHDEFKDRLMVEKRGTVTRDITNVEEGTLAMTEAWIIKEFGIDFDLFQCTVVFGQDSKFNFVNEANGEQKKILSKVMRVNFSNQHAKAKEELKTNQALLIDFDKKVAVLESHKGVPDDFWAQEGDWDMDQKNRIEKAKSEMKALWDEKSKIEKDLKARPREGFEKLKTMLAEKMSALNLIEAATRESLSDLKGEIGTIKSEVSRHEKLSRASKCPTCESPVLASKCKSQIAELSERQVEVEAAISTTTTKLELISDRKSKYLDKKESISDALYEIATAEKTLVTAKNSWAERKAELEELKVETNPFTARMEVDREKQKQIAAKLEELTLEVKDLKDKEPYLQFWVNAFGDNGIKSFIFDVICSSLTEKSNAYLNKLSDGEIAVSFDTQKKLKSGEVREKFDCQVITDGQAVEYKAYSGGEKTRISRAVDLGLSGIMSDNYGSDFNFLVMDEQDIYLDDSGRKRYMELLRELSKTKSVYVIAHDAKLKAAFTETIMIKKVGGFSEISL